MQICCKRGSIAAVGVDFRSGIRNAVDGTGDRGIKVFLAVETLIPSAENVPPQTGGDGQRLGGVERILDKGRIVRIGLSREDVFGKTRVVTLIAFGAGRASHSNKKRGEIAAARHTRDRLIRSIDVEPVCARRRRRLADIKVALHPLEAERNRMLAMNFGDSGVGVAIFAGILKIVVVSGAADASTNVIKEDEGQLVEDDLRCQRGGKAHTRNVGTTVCWISLILVVPRKGVTQVQDGGGI